MNGSHRKERLSAPLMHAFRSANATRDAKKKIDLRTEAGERVIAGRRTSGRMPVTDSVLRREVAIDLESLMNTIAFESSEDLEEFDLVRKSILNFGLPDVGHRTLEDGNIVDIGKEIEDSLVQLRAAPRSQVDPCTAGRHRLDRSN